MSDISTDLVEVKKDIKGSISRRDSRFFAVVFYGTEEDLLLCISKISRQIAYYAYCIHDKDTYLNDRFNDKGELVNKSGDLENTHIQLYVEYYDCKTFSSVRKHFSHDDDKPMVQTGRDKVLLVRYLRHLDNPEKYQYSVDEVFYSNVEYFEKLSRYGDRRKDGDNIALMIIDDIMRGVSPLIMARRYGREYIINMQKYKDYARLCEDYEIEHRVRDRFVELIESTQEEIPFD